MRWQTYRCNKLMEMSLPSFYLRRYIIYGKIIEYTRLVDDKRGPLHDVILTARDRGRYECK